MPRLRYDCALAIRRRRIGSSFAALLSDRRYGGQPFRIAGRGSIRGGESGGVTLVGLMASLAGAALAPAAFAATGALSPSGAALVVTAGFAGGVIDSALGGSLQYRGRDPRGDVVEDRWIGSARTEHVSGLAWLDNAMVNLVSGLAAGAIAAGLVGLFAGA